MNPPIHQPAKEAAEKILSSDRISNLYPSAPKSTSVVISEIISTSYEPWRKAMEDAEQSLNSFVLSGCSCSICENARQTLQQLRAALKEGK